jgi:predicted chitinase
MNLSATQKTNINFIIDEAKKAGITNPLTLAALLSIAYKESGLIPKAENLNYTAERIRQVWNKTSQATAQNLANNPINLANYFYGGKFGNNAVNDGFLYRGRGFNQITFRGNYKTIGKQIGHNLESNPDLLLNPKIAAKAFIQFYLNTANRNKLDLNKLTNKTAIDTIYQINAGKLNKPIKDTTGGYKRAKDNYNTFLEIVAPGTAKDKNNIIVNLLLVTLIGGFAYYYYKKG